MSAERLRSIRPQALFGLAAGVGCVLLALLGIELRSAAEDVVPTRPLAAPIAPVGDALSPDATATATATATLPAGAVANATRVILARPLFSPQRRPPSVAVSGPQRPRLAGIIVGPNGRRAIFAGGGDNARGSVVGVGQQAGAWHVMAIEDTGVRVSGPDGVRVLHPSRDKAAARDGNDAVPGMPSHPSILDLLRNHNAMAGGGGLMGGRFPSLGTGEQQSPQQTAPAAPE